jgi:MFS family permease
MEARLERLGRERPPAFPSLFAEVMFCFSILMSQILTEFFVSGFTVIVPTLIDALDIPQNSSVWPATAFSLVIASTLLVFGRLGDMWGGYPVFISGLAWLVVWSLIAGFSINPMMLIFCRALQGIGPAAFLPTGVMLIGSVYRPGPRKNIVFALYGACAIAGFFLGIFVAGVVGQYLRWGYYFWIGTILAGLTLVASIFYIPNDHEERKKNNITMDYWGALTIVCGVVLVVFAITESAHAADGWRTPYIPTLFVFGCLSLIAAAYIEGWVAKLPILPPDIFAAKALAPLVVALMLLYGTMGIFLLYGTLYFQNIMGATPLQVVAWFTPMAVGGLLITLVEGFILHLVSGRILLIISGLGAVGSQILPALIPVGGNYWAWIFPACVCGTIGIDVSYTVMTVYITTTLPSARQGLAGGLINSILQLGIALCLGLTDIMQSYTVDSQGLRQSYKNTFWFGVGAASVSLVLMALWGKVPKAKSDLTADEKAELERVASQPGT